MSSCLSQEYFLKTYRYAVRRLRLAMVTVLCVGGFGQSKS